MNDEGIYFEGARRVLAGQVPYRDFFNLTGPGTFWLQAAVFRLFGESFRIGRLLMAVDLALLAALVYWLTAKLAGRGPAAFVTLFFVALDTSNLHALVANHRWDSCALAMTAVVLGFVAMERDRRWLWGIAGVSAAWAAWITPTVLALTLALAAWVAARRDLRSRLVPYLAGVALASAAPLLYLASRAALFDMVRHMLWSGSNYPRANTVSYGMVIGGWSGVLADAAGVQRVLITIILFFIVIPAYLPLANFLAWPLRLWRERRLDREILYLLTAAAGLWLSAYPWFLGHLINAAAPAFVLGGTLIHRIARRGRAPLAVASCFCSVLFLWNTLRPGWSAPKAATRVGPVHGHPSDLAMARNVAATIGPGQTLFVFPYKPIIYFLTGGRNPTRYSFLQPSMMNDRDELSVLDDLRRRPPEWVFYEHVPPESYLRIWPGSDPARLRLNRIEDFLVTEYQVYARYRHPAGEYRLLRPRDAYDSAARAASTASASPGTTASQGVWSGTRK